MSMTLARNILVCTDLSSASDAALHEASRWAAWCDATVHILHVEQPPVGAEAVDITISAQGELIHRTLNTFEEVLRRTIRDDVRIGERWVRLGDVRRTILAAAAQLNADLIVVGSHGRTGVGRALLGSVAEAVIRDADRPVLLARARAPGMAPPSTRGRDGAPARVWIVALDLLPPSEQTLAMALEYATAAGAEADLLHVYAPLLVSSSAYAELSPHDSLHRRVLQELGELARPHRGSPAMGKCIAAAGEPRWMIANSADEFGAELLVLGWNAPSLAQLVLGQVHTSLLRHAPCSVLIAKQR
jgi:nucleotide-binding universal stress UspA family protein